MHGGDTFSTMSEDMYDPEAHAERVADIQELSDTVAVASLQFTKLLSQLGWSQEYLRAPQTFDEAVCPIDPAHRIRSDRLQEHVHVCLARKAGLVKYTKSDIHPSSWFSYGGCKSVVPVFIGDEEYAKLGIDIVRMIKPEDSLGDKAEKTLDDEVLCPANELSNSFSTLHEDNSELNEYVASDALDQLRFIYSWTKIPKNFLVFDATCIDTQVLKNWMLENLPKPKSVLALGAAVQLTDVIFSWLNDAAVAFPDGIMTCLREIFQDDAREFVLRLWKFMAASKLCKEASIPQNTRKEFEFYSLSMSLTKGSRVEGSADDITSVKERVSSSGEGAISKEHLRILPNEWVSGALSTEKRLALYEHIIQVGKLLAPTTSSSADVVQSMEEITAALDAANQMNADEQQSHLEMIAALRDYKRRRQAYRGKSASAKKKLSRLAVLREQVDQVMVFLAVKSGALQPADQPDRDRDIALRSGLGQPAPARDSSRPPPTRSGEESRPSRDSSRSRSARRSRSRSRSRESRLEGCKIMAGLRRERRFGDRSVRQRSVEDRRYNDAYSKRSQDDHSEKRRRASDSSPEMISNVTYYDSGPSDDESGSKMGAN